jgi:uncharacterized protein YbaP (TraB family)
MYFQLTGTNVRLLGSMHMFPAASPDIPAWVSQAYEWSESLVFESDSPTILPLIKVQGGAGLKSMLSADVWAALEAFWPSTGPLSPLGALHPWAAMLFAPTFSLQSTEGVEPRFLRSAIEQSKPFQFLETTQELAASFESISLAEIQASLKLIVSDLTEPQRQLNSMHAAWLRRDLQSLHQVASQSPMFDFPTIRSAVLDSRNRAWVPAVSNLIGSPKRTLVIVGALHLYGLGNLIECLGHPIEPVPING